MRGSQQTPETRHLLSRFGCWVEGEGREAIEHQKHAHMGVFLVLNGSPSLPFYPTPKTRQQMLCFRCSLAPLSFHLNMKNAMLHRVFHVGWLLIT